MVFGFGLVTQQAICGELGDHGLVFCYSLGQFWVHWCGLGLFFFLVECQFQGFGSIWFMRWDGLDFWKLMRLGVFFVRSNQLKGGIEPLLYALGKRNFD